MTTVTDTVPSGFDGERIDRFVAALVLRSRSVAAELVKAGAVTVDAMVMTKPSKCVNVGQQVIVELPDKVCDLPVADPTVLFEVVYQDEHLLVIHKPAGLVVHAGVGQHDSSLVNGILARYPDVAEVGEPNRPGIVHRLDKHTSGLLVVARTEPVRKALIDALAAHLPERHYTALVWGHVDSSAGRIDAPIGRSLRQPTRMTVSESGRRAVTHYRVNCRYRLPCALSLLECRLETGRTHQIRVHLRSIGHPVVGDRQYDGGRPGPDPGRPFLHARRLRFIHPVTGEPVNCFAPLPADLAEVLSQCTPQD